MLFIIVAGWLSHRDGGKGVLGSVVFTWSVFTLLTPWAATHSTAVLIAVRIGLGVCEAAVPAAPFELLGGWVPPHERTRAITRFLSRTPCAQVLGFIGTGWIVAHSGWPMAFY